MIVALPGLFSYLFFVLQPVSQRALIERHVALEQVEIKRDVEAVAEGIGDGLVGRDCIDANSRCVSVTRRIDALVLGIFLSEVVFQRSP